MQCWIHWCWLLSLRIMTNLPEQGEGAYSSGSQPLPAHQNHLGRPRKRMKSLLLGMGPRFQYACSPQVTPACSRGWEPSYRLRLHTPIVEAASKWNLVSMATCTSAPLPFRTHGEVSCLVSWSHPCPVSGDRASSGRASFLFSDRSIGWGPWYNLDSKRLLEKPFLCEECGLTWGVWRSG